MNLLKNLIVAFLVMTITFFCSSVMADQHQSSLSLLHPIAIESAKVLAPGKLAIDAGGAMEFDREVRTAGGLEYDNVRVLPTGVRFGLESGFEVGATLAFSANDANDVGAPDDSGVEGLSLFGKVELNKFSALRAGVTLGGDDDVAPYPNDGIDFFFYLALQSPMEYGLLYGEFGYKAQGGDFDFNSYFNYGVGFAAAITDTISANLELVGEQAQDIPISNALDFVMGVNLLIVDGFRLAPYLSLGLTDASPDFASGAVVELRF